MKREDRRVRRTVRLLKEGLLSMIDEKQYDAITIRDITDRADIGYATFFRHYDGKDELMLEMFTQMIEDLEAQTVRHSEAYFEQEGQQLFSHVLDNNALYRSVLDSRTFRRRFSDHIRGMVQAHLERHAERVKDSLIPIEIGAQHMTASILGLIEWWLREGQPYPIERMALIYDRLIIQATWQALEGDDPLFTSGN